MVTAPPPPIPPTCVCVSVRVYVCVCACVCACTCVRPVCMPCIPSVFADLQLCSFPHISQFSGRVCRVICACCVLRFTLNAHARVRFSQLCVCLRVCVCVCVCVKGECKGVLLETRGGQAFRSSADSQLEGGLSAGRQKLTGGGWGVKIPARQSDRIYG